MFGVFGACLGDVWGMFGACLGHVWGMFGGCLGHVLGMFWGARGPKIPPKIPIFPQRETPNSGFFFPFCDQ